jgi:hypothetical protein
MAATHRSNASHNADAAFLETQRSPETRFQIIGLAAVVLTVLNGNSGREVNVYTPKLLVKTE